MTVVFGSNLNQDADQPSSSPSPSKPAEPGKRAFILIIEDNEADVFLIREAIESKVQADIEVLTDGEKAIRFLEDTDRDALRSPELIVLDVNLPKKNGGQVLSYVRDKSRYMETLVLVVTSSGSAADRTDMYRRGANGYFRKPSEYAEFMKLGDIIRRMLAESFKTAS